MTHEFGTQRSVKRDRLAPKIAESVYQRRHGCVSARPRPSSSETMYSYRKGQVAVNRWELTGGLLGDSSEALTA